MVEVYGVIFTCVAFGDLLLQRRKSKQKVAPQVPGRLIFRKSLWRGQHAKIAFHLSAFLKHQ